MGIQARDIRDRLREDHDTALAELEALRAEDDAHRCKARLIRLRQAWRVHALAEETVVYRALEGEAANLSHAADERFVEHDLIGGLFEKLVALDRATLEWPARLRVLCELIARHIDKEHEDLFTQLGQRFPADELAEMGRRFELASEKLALLEEAKAA